MSFKGEKLVCYALMIEKHNDGYLPSSSMSSSDRDLESAHRGEGGGVLKYV